MIGSAAAPTAALLALIPTLAAPQDRPDLDHPLFRQIEAKSPSLSFAGVRKVTFRGRGDHETTFTERVLRKGDLLRIEYPAGTPYEGQIIVENSGGRYHYLPAEKIIRKTPRRSGSGVLEMNAWLGPRGPFSGRVEIKTYYGGRVAGVKTTYAKLKRSDGKTFLKLWVDEDKGCILKREMFDGHEKSIGGWEFTDIKYDPKLDRSIFALSIPGVPILTVADEMRKLARELGMKPYQLRESSGFTLIRVHKFDSEKIQSLMQIYTNGKVRLSFFQVKGELDGDRLKKQAGDRANVYVWKRDGASFALLGDLEEDDLKSLARNLKL